MRPILAKKLDNLPRSPGVYLYKNDSGEIIYVGKAKNLKARVRSYFQKGIDPDSKTYVLVQSIADLDYIEVSLELEALILEAELIKKHKPKFNIELKDDKSYLYIVIRKEGPGYPKIVTARKPQILKSDTAFGPYPDGKVAKQIIRALRKIFRYRDCNTLKFNRYKKIEKPCLYGHINLCPAPCIGAISTQKYNQGIQKVKNLLLGQSAKVLQDLTKKMNGASKKHQYEQAIKYRNLIEKFEYIRQSFKTAQNYIDNPYLVDDLIEKSLTEVKKLVPELKNLKKSPKVIECYDIANISGKDAVGSMVVAVNGKIDKSRYRKFRIRLKDEPDDFEMLKEVLTRRLKSRNIKKWGRPDLIVLDGGKGQVSAGIEAVKESGLKIPLIGLAKKQETTVLADFTEINLERTNEGLKLLQRLRDEAHRFAQRYHHHIRLKSLRPK